MSSLGPKLVIKAIIATVDSVEGSSEEHVVDIRGPSASTAAMIGPLEVMLSGRTDGFSWSVGNGNDRSVRLRAGQRPRGGTKW